MKKVLLVCLMGMISFSVFAADSTKVFLTKKEFRAKQQAYITKKAQLTPQEAQAFFSLFFEMKDKVKKVSNEEWQHMRALSKKSATEAEYEKVLDEIYSNKVENARTEKEYYEKLKKVLPPQKLYEALKAEMMFHRALLRGMKRGSHLKACQQVGKECCKDMKRK